MNIIDDLMDIVNGSEKPREGDTAEESIRKMKAMIKKEKEIKK